MLYSVSFFEIFIVFKAPIYYHAQLSPLIRIAKYPCVVDETNYLNEISYDQISKLFYNSNIIHPTHRVALIPKHIPGNVIF